MFLVPADFVPQYIVPGFSTTRLITKQAENEAVTTVFSMKGGKFGIEKFNVMEEKYFFPKDNIRTAIYETLQKADNKAIDHEIQQFVNNWSRITVEAAFSFSTVIRQVSSCLVLPDKQEDPNASVDLSIS